MLIIDNPNAGSADAVRQLDRQYVLTPAAEGIIPLTTYMHALLGQVRSDCPDLTNRQMAMLLVVHIIDAPHTVGSLAGLLDVAKPVVSRALDKLELLSYVNRRRGVRDRRDVFIDRTIKGAAFLDRFASRIL